MDKLIAKLDLTEYLNNFSKLFSRKKSIILEGDINIHLKLINELSNYNFNPPIKVENLDLEILHLQKQGTLKIYQIFEFIKIINYFNYLKKINFESKLLNWFERIFIPDDILVVSEYFDDKGNIKEGINEELDNTKNAIIKNKEEIKQSLYKLINSSKLKPYLVDSQVHFINSQEALLLRGGFSNILSGSIIERSNSGFFYIVPHSISQLRHKENDLKNRQEDILLKFCKDISSIFEKNLPFIKFINKEFDRFDHYQARLFFAKISDKIFVLPSKNNENKIIDFCHPALNNPKPVTIDFSKSVIMITGVNAGGKTMLLKSILSSVFLSKYLIPFKANEKTIISNYKFIEAILDDPQSVKNDISTFAGRIVEFSHLFNSKNTIVGIDEIELGTDADEAASLFKVIIEELIQKDIKIIITTHHKRLASLMASNKNVELIAALYDEEKQKTTYDFLQGTIGRSYAFETALRYGIPLSIIKKAKEVYGKDKDNLNELIQRSSSLEKEYKEKIFNLDQEILRVKKITNNLKEQKEKLDEHMSIEKYKLEKEYISARDEPKKAIKAKLVSQSHQHLNVSHKIAKEIKVEKIQEKIEFKIGDKIKYRSAKGIIISIKGNKAYIENEFGIKIQVNISDLRMSESEAIKIKKNKISLHIKKPEIASVKLDLHGQRADEAIEKLDKFLSDALLAGFEEVLVYHGIGTGRLSFVVKEFLKKHPRVKSFEDAHPNSGGFGAKVIKL